MTQRIPAIGWVYLAIAVAALVGTQASLIAFLTEADNGGFGGMVDDLVATPAATFATVDLLAVAVAATVFMVAEGRRLRMRWLWVYVVLVFTVAISVALPVFLFARLRALGAEVPSASLGDAPGPA